MNAVLAIAWRSLWRHKRRTLITISSIAVGLTCAIFFISLAWGTYFQITNDAVRMQAGHLTYEHTHYREAPAVDLYVNHISELRRNAQTLAAVENTKAMILAQGVAKSGIGAVGVALVGVEAKTEAAISPIAKNVVKGSYLAPDDLAQAVIGSKLAEHLNLDVGKKLVITTNDVNGSLVEVLCRVRGIFRTGSDEVDAYLIQVPIEFARKLYGMPADSATQVGIVLRNPDDQAATLALLRPQITSSDLTLRPWEEIIPEVASWIRLDKGSNYIFQCVLLFLILFTIFNTILMSVLERQREFAVMLAIGTPPRSLSQQILIESTFIGLIGSLVGVTVGALIAWGVSIHGIDISKLYTEGVSISGFAINTILRCRLTWELLATVGAIVFAATILVSLAPMRRAAKIAVVDWLR